MTRPNMTPFVRSIGATTVTFAIASLGFAQLPGGPPDGRSGPRFQDVLLHETFDADGDGRLDRAERDLAREAASQGQRRNRRGGPPGAPQEDLDRARPHDAADALRMNPKAAKRFPGAGLYDRDVLHTLFIEFDANDWHDEMVAFYSTDIEVPARLLLDGVLVGEVGVSYRGNTSFQRAFKKSFGISIDAFDDDLRIDGYRTLNLLNTNGDASLMREVLFSNIAGKYMPAPKANFVRVVVNGVYLGVYANVQQINKDFTKEHFGTRKGVRWKVPPDFSGGGSLADLGDDIDEYRSRYELKTESATDEDWRDLIELCGVLKNTPIKEIEAVLPKYIDIDEALWFLALDNVFMDSDGYFSRGSDYYVYKDPAGLFHMVHYDNNETFGGGRGGGGRRGPGQGPGQGPGGGPPPFGPLGAGAGLLSQQDPPEDRDRASPDRPRRGGAPRRDDRRDRRGQRGAGGPGGPGGPGGRGGTQMTPTLSPFEHENERDTRSLIACLLAVDAWRAQYIENIRTLLENELAWEHLSKRVNHWRALIQADVARDPFQSGINTFNAAIDGPNNSIQALIGARLKYLQNHEALQSPTTQ